MLDDVKNEECLGESEADRYGWICPVCGACVNPDYASCPEHEFSAAPFMGAISGDWSFKKVRLCLED